jgi:hypothetical protein
MKASSCAPPEAHVVWPTQPLAPTKSSAFEANKGLLAAVHSEMPEVQRRKQSVVVTGLKPVDAVSKTDLYAQSCLPFKPKIDKERCRRLGKPQPGKVCRLLVALRNQDSDMELLRCAEMLKQSTEGARIYINPDITPAEAKVTYDQRQRRCMRTASRQQVDSPS